MIRRSRDFCDGSDTVRVTRFASTLHTQVIDLMAPVDPRSRVLVVAGMHPSGTSFLASLLHRGGCRMGEAMLAGDAHNRPGYFEDLEFLELNRRMLAATVPADAPGHTDWGWTENVEAS